MTRDDLLQDIAYVRSLAEAGQEAPLLGGRMLAFWGGLTAIALATQWALLVGLAPLPPLVGAWGVWIAYGLVGGGAMPFLLRELEAAPGVSAMNNRVSEAVWLMAPLGLGAVFAGLLGATALVDAPSFVWNVLPAAGLILYGVAHLTTAAFMKGRDGRWAGMISLAAGAATLALMTRSEANLVAACGFLFGAFIPGLLQMRREPASVV